MKTCDYCGKSNEDLSLLCGGCGTEFPTEDLSPVETAPKPAVPPGILTAGRAAFILLTFVVAAFFFDLSLACFKGLGFISTTQSIFFSTLFASIVAISVAVKLVPASITDTTPAGAAWVRGPWAVLVKCLLLGIAIEMFSRLVRYLNPDLAQPSQWEIYSWSKITKGWPLLLLSIQAIIIAPTIEELLFRGVLYGGLCKSFGPMWSGSLTTLFFVALHLPGFHLSLYGTFCITIVTLATLWARLHWKAIGPAIAIHMGYNATIILGAILQK